MKSRSRDGLAAKGLLPQVKVSEKSLRLTFRNIGVNINWCRPLFCISSKIAPKIHKLIIIIYGIYIALYPDAQSTLQHFVEDFARLLIKVHIAATQFLNLIG